jgi:methionine-rich copper-binding protein CopC
MSKLRLAFTAPVLAMLAFAGTAQAHTRLVSSSPAANATVAKPGKVVLTFNERVVANFTGVDLIMTSMPGMAMSEPMKMSGFSSAMSADGKTLTLLMRRALPAGTYQLKWHAVGDDTHRMEGTFSFTVK